MQLIKFGETVAAKSEIQFTSVQSANLQNRITGGTLANGSITVKIKRAGVATVVSGTGSFTTTDDTGAPGVRGYVPSVGDQSLGVCAFVFTGAAMEPREVPVMFVAFDPFDGIRAGLSALRPDPVLIATVASGALGAASFPATFAIGGVTVTVPAGQLANEAHLRFLGNVTAGLAGQVQKIAGWSGGLLSFAAPFGQAPAVGDLAEVING